MDQAKTSAVAGRPFEVIKQAPKAVAAHGHAFGGRALQHGQVIAQKHDPIAVVDDAVFRRLVIRAAAAR